jgi:AGCS family alanine or glycine:cation symporter
MVIMTSCNLIAITFLGKYAIMLLDDYRQQRRAGKDPTYKAETCPEIANETECW